ncbi:hypothetical protein [Streptomyces sp. KR80]|uniref:hypothetical protein n=1 Tax=Streptomyces sp. KR80 TaxID=3457426 RepID=UPI003FD4C0EF
MPRPTAAQLAYGSATVVFSTVAMLLLSQTHSGIGVVVIAFAGLALGLLVAVTVPLPRTDVPRTDEARTDVAPAHGTAHRTRPIRTCTNSADSARPASPVAASERRLASRAPHPRTHATAGSHVGEHSLRR